MKLIISISSDCISGSTFADNFLFYALKFSLCSAAAVQLYVLVPTISFIIFWDFSMFYQTFLSPQAKRWAIITDKHGVYKLPHELPNNLRLRILEN